MTTEEIRVRVAEGKQRDAGRGKARIKEETMRALNIVARAQLQEKELQQLWLGQRSKKIKRAKLFELIVW